MGGYWHVYNLSTGTTIVGSLAIKILRLPGVMVRGRMTAGIMAYGMIALGMTALAGCSENSFKDSFDMGKFSPDETKVQANRSLTMPPDLQLRAPDGSVPNRPVANNAPPVSTQPPQYGTAPQYGAQPQYGTQPPQYGQPPQRQASLPPATQPVVPRQDVYARNGISRPRPDGSPKTNEELINELRAKKKSRQRAANPNYGTVFNLPKVWSDSQ